MTEVVEYDEYADGPVTCETYKHPSGQGMSGLHQLTREDLESIYEEKVCVLFDIIAWMELGRELNEFPFEAYGIDDDRAGDYQLSIGECMAGIEHFFPVNKTIQ